MCFAVHLIAARSQAAPLPGSIPLLTWTITGECVTSAGMSFFGDLAAEYRLGGRKWNLFLDCETWKEMTADRCITIGGLWCCLRLTWTESEGDAHQHLVMCLCSTENSLVRFRGCLASTRQQKNCIRIFAFPDLFISLLLFYVGTKLSSWVGHRAYRFPWDCSMCPPLQKGEAVQSFHCLLLPQPGSHMTWHDPKLIWIPVTPMPAFFIRSLFFMPPFSSSVELPPSEGALSAFLACWGVKKKRQNKTPELIPACWCISPWVRISLPLCFHSFSSYLVRSETRRGKNLAQTFFCFTQKAHVRETLSPAGSLGTVEEEVFVMEGGLLGML